MPRSLQGITRRGAIVLVSALLLATPSPLGAGVRARRPTSVRAAVSTRAAVTAACGKLLPPAFGMYFGAFPDFYYYPPGAPVYEEDYVRASKVDEFEQLAHRNIVWANFSQHWFKGLDFPRESILTLWRNGQIPFVRLYPDSGYLYGPFPPLEQLPEQHFSLQHIIDGQFDAQLRAWADAAREMDIPILAQFGAEINADHWPWSPAWSGAGQTDGYGDPTYPDGAERFRDAYRHIVTLFREEGATNVTWFFHVDAYRQNDWWNEFKWYYPGDQYIDWLGISNYGANVVGQPVYGFAEKLDGSGVYNELANLSRRPMAILETGVVENSTYPKPRWIRDTFSVLRSRRYRRIYGVAWWNAGSGDVDVRVDSSPAALAAFRKAIRPSFFGARPRFGGNCRPSTPANLVARRTQSVVRLTWQTSIDATSYEIWRGKRRLATTAIGDYVDRRPSHRPIAYRVRGRSPVGFGRFSISVTVP
jgi:Glycosyl hydrolase family 26